MDLGIAGRWALIGGASKGLGLGCASALVREGVNVVINARTAEPLAAAAQALRAQNPNVTVIAVAGDITCSAGRAAIFEQRRDFDIVVTNAGGPPTGDFRSWSRETWLAAIDGNMLTPIELIKATLDSMMARGYGRVINITSSAVKAPIDVLGLSNGARSGLTGFIAGLARSESAAKGVTINNLLPGIFDTDRLKSNFEAQAKKLGQTVEQVRAARIASHPAKRLGTPEEFGSVCAFLCSRQASYINGQNILIDGGGYPGTF